MRATFSQMTSMAWGLGVRQARPSAIAVRDGASTTCAAAEAERIGRGFGGHDADDFGLQAQGVAGGRDAADGRAQADGHIDDIERRRGLKELQRIGGRAHHQPLVEGFDHGEAAIGGEACAANSSDS